MNKFYSVNFRTFIFFTSLTFLVTQGKAQSLILQSSLDISGAVGGGNVGVALINNEYWVSKWNQDSVFRLTPTGAVIERFVIPGITGIRSMTWDGTSIYAGRAGRTVVKIDPQTKTVIQTIPTPVDARHISYVATANNNAGGLWIGNYSTDLVLISLTGATLKTIPASTHGLTRMYGSAYDSTTADGGPHLWVFDYANPNTAINFWRIPTSTGIPDYKYNILNDFPAVAGDPAGGAFMSFDPSTGARTLIGLLQALPNTIVRYAVPNTLPVTIKSFTGERKGSKNTLRWATATEQNNQGFTIQRSADGGIFSRIGFTQSKAIDGNSVSDINYVFEDGFPLKGDNYYRLVQIDKDGRTSYSSTIVVKGSPAVRVEMVRLYPNPSVSFVKIALSTAREGKITFVITDMKGQRLMTQHEKALAGNNVFNVKIQKLQAGTYVLNALGKDGKSISTIKFIKH